MWSAKYCADTGFEIINLADMAVVGWGRPLKKGERPYIEIYYRDKQFLRFEYRTVKEAAQAFSRIQHHIAWLQSQETEEEP